MEITVGKSLHGRKNNFDLIRFIGAVMVIWFHSFPLTGQSNAFEFVTHITKGETTAGALGVVFFFIISGFLITMSFDHSKSIIRFLKARILRIMPAYVVVIMLSIIILGPLLTTLPLWEYVFHPQTREYLLNLTLKSMHYNLPGVFSENLWPNAVNGSLWTLWYEFFYYIVVAALGFVKGLRKEIALLLFLLFFGLIIFKVPLAGYYYYVYFGMYFFSGMSFYLWREYIKLNWGLAAISLGGLVVGVFTHTLVALLSLAGAYLIFFFALGPVKKFTNFTKYGDFSYGLYIYSFVVQQVLEQISQNSLTQLENFFYTLPFAMVFAFLSWHLVEKKFIALKNVPISKWFQRKVDSHA